MSINTDNFEACIVAVLAVNNFGLEKAYGLLPAFRQAGLTNSSEIAKSEKSKVMMTMANAGYDRGLLTEMMAGRLIDLMKSVVDGKFDALDALIAEGDKHSAIDILCQVKGIGPKVAEDVWMLVRSGNPTPVAVKQIR